MSPSRLHRRALVLSFRHPYGATEMMADSLAAALRLNGYQASTAILNTPTFQQDLAAGLSDPDLELVMCTGSWPLKLVVQSGVPLWRFLPDRVLFVVLVIDALPYDFRMPFFVSFLQDYAGRGNLVAASFDRITAAILGRHARRKVFYMPHGGYLAPPLREAPRHPDRLMLWASIEAELARSDSTASVLRALEDTNPWGFDPAALRAVADRLLQSGQWHGLQALADAVDMSVEEMLAEEWTEELCVIDSALKRYRRGFLVDALRDFPLDIYGKNWERRVADAPAIRLKTPEPDHNAVFSHVCQHYGGVLNIDPNWGEGTNERAASALAMGARLATSRNPRVDGIAGCFQYDLTRESIRAACEQALNGPRPAPRNAGFAWEYVVSTLLAEIAADARPGPPR